MGSLEGAMLIKEEVDQRRSFSFSSLDFNSFFDEDEGSIVDQEGVYSGDDDDNDDAYIEINLDRPPQTNVQEKKDDDLEFRVSFLEAALPFIGISSPPSNSYCSLPVDWPPVTDKRKVPLFLPVNHLLNTLEGSPAGESMGDDHCRNSSISNDESKQLVLRMSRCGSRTGNGGGMMNMMIKFRYVMSFRWMVTSMLKIRRQQQRQAIALSSQSSSTSGADSSSNNQNMSKRQKKPPRQQVIGNSNNAAEKSRSSVLLLRLGLKLDAIKGVVASDNKIGGKRHRGDGGGKHSKSCPGSIKSSPLHHQGGGTLVYIKDSSVQAAIAHCKKSFGSSEDFSF